MIDVSKFSFIKGTYPIEGESTRAIKQKINHALSVNKRHSFGAITTHTDNHILFSTDKAGLMPGATIYNDVIQFGDAIVVCSHDNHCYFLLIKDSNVIYENIVDIKESTEAILNHLKIALYNLGTDAKVICSEMPIEKNDGSIVVDKIIELPHSIDNVFVKPHLAELLTSEKMLDAVDMKMLSINGQRVQRQWYYSAASIILALGTVITLNMQDEPSTDDQKMPSFASKAMSSLKETAGISPMLPEVSPTPSYEGLYDWYTKESISPFHTLRLMHRNMRLFESVDGWEVIQGKFSTESGAPVITFKLKEDQGADIQAVSDIAIRGNWKIAFKDKVFTVFKTVNTRPLFKNAGRFQISSYEKYISTGIKDWWDDTSFNSTVLTVQNNAPAEPESEGDVPPAPKLPYEKKLIKITKPDYTSFDLQSFGSFLKGHPYSLKAVTLTKDGADIPDEDVQPQRRRRNEKAPVDTTENDTFTAFNAEYELVLLGVTTR